MEAETRATDSCDAAALAQARERALVALHLPRVRASVNRLAWRLPSAVDREDLVQSGVLGLIDAARRFDPARGCSFETYCDIRIRGAVLDQLRALDWAPRSVRESERALDRGRRAIEQREGRAAESAEVADQLGLTPERFDALCSLLRAVSPPRTDAALDNQGVMLSAFSPPWVESEATNPLSALGTARERKVITGAIAGLPEPERNVVALLYWNELLPEQIARVLGLDESRVRNLHARALLRLRGRLREIWE
jgi:RNA polymerase sigma factor for flagellar operon FliA